MIGTPAARASRKKTYYAGISFVPYDLAKEFLGALLVVSVIVLILSIVFSSPDVPPLTLKSIATSNPQTFVSTSLDMLDGNSPISTYGPPYNNGTDSVQSIGPISPQQWFGVHIPVNTAQDYVLGPLTTAATTDAPLKRSLTIFNAAPASQQSKWEGTYSSALAKATEKAPALSVPVCDCGPLRTMMSAFLALGQSGAMDGSLLTSNHFYQTDFTRPLLFLQNDVTEAQAQKYNITGSQWGVMNETGNYPGQAWLWLYTFFYQIPPYNSAWAANADALAIVSVTILSIGLLLTPWIPGINRLPRYLGIYKLIWKNYYRGQEGSRAPTASPDGEGGAT